jgi:hypothetical protein
MNEAEITRRLSHVEKELATHSTVLAANAESMKSLMERSDERLDYIKERFDEGAGRFDRLEHIIAGNMIEILAARRRIIGAATTVFCTVLTAAWFVIVLPMQEQLAYLDRRLMDAEKRIAVHLHDDGPA